MLQETPKRGFRDVGKETMRVVGVNQKVAEHRVRMEVDNSRWRPLKEAVIKAKI